MTLPDDPEVTLRYVVEVMVGITEKFWLKSPKGAIVPHFTSAIDQAHPFMLYSDADDMRLWLEVVFPFASIEVRKIGLRVVSHTELIVGTLVGATDGGGLRAKEAREAEHVNTN